MSAKAGTKSRTAPSRIRAAGLALLVVLLCALAGCGETPVRPTTPSLHERQVETLRSLGFSEGDDGWLMNIAEPISFDFNQADLRGDLRPQLEDAARKLLAAKLHALRIEGHTDQVGSRDYNERLSLRRSEAVAAIFIGQGYARNDIESRGLAWDFPIASNDTREGRAENRRVVVIVPAESMAPQP